MRKRLIASLMLGLLAGCDGPVKTMSFPAAPPELKDCKFFKLTNAEGETIRVARCPNSATTVTYAQGKAQVSLVTVDESGGQSLPQPAPQVTRPPEIAPLPDVITAYGHRYVLTRREP